jgi:hypothetical protein
MAPRFRVIAALVLSAVSSRVVETIQITVRFVDCQSQQTVSSHQKFREPPLASAIVQKRELDMTLSEQIQKDIVAAMRAKEELRLSVLRMVKSAIQLKEVEKKRPLDEPESIQLLQTLVKQRKESIDQFAKGGRQDLVDKENKELLVLEAYLPAGASIADMDDAIDKAIATTGATSMKQMGGVVKSAKDLLTGKAVDGKALSDRVRDRLSKVT